jgi:hypothetical protein
VDAYSIHYYRLSFDYLTGNPAHREVATTIRDAVDKHTAKIARYCRARGKPLWAPEIGTFHYGWRFGNPAGPTTLEATLTVAEALLRAVNAGVDAFAFWCFMNPNTIDGHWRIVGIEDGRLVRTAYPCATYGLVSRLVRPGSRVQPPAGRPARPPPRHRLHRAVGRARPAARQRPPGRGGRGRPGGLRRLGRSALRLPAGLPRGPRGALRPGGWRRGRRRARGRPADEPAGLPRRGDRRNRTALGLPQACLDPGGGLGFA